MSPHAPLATSLAASPPPVATTRKSTCGLWASRRASCHWQATPRLSRASHSRPARTRSCPAPRQAPWKCGTWRWASRCATCSATSRRSRASSTTTTPTTSRPARLTRRFACGIWGARAVSSRTKATRTVWMAFASGFKSLLLVVLCSCFRSLVFNRDDFKSSALNLHFYQKI